VQILKTPEEAQECPQATCDPRYAKRAFDHDVVADGCRQYSKNSSAYVFRRNPYALFRAFRAPPRFWGWSFAALEKQGVDLTSIFLMICPSLSPRQKFPGKATASARLVPGAEAGILSLAGG